MIDGVFWRARLRDRDTIHENQQACQTWQKSPRRGRAESSCRRKLDAPVGTEALSQPERRGEMTVRRRAPHLESFRAAAARRAMPRAARGRWSEQQRRDGASSNYVGFGSAAGAPNVTNFGMLGRL